jgi:hypothetical protein
MAKRIPFGEVIDSGARLVTRVGPEPLAVLVLATLPWRFGLAALASRIVEVGESASQYGPHWREWSENLLPLFILAVLGRAFYAHACHQHLQQGLTQWRNLIPSPLTLLAVLYLSFALEIALIVSAVTLLGWAIFASMQASVLASQPGFTQASPLDPWKVLSRNRDSMSRIAGLDSIFTIAWVVALLNLVSLTQMAPDLLGALPGFDPGPARVLLSVENHRLWFGLMAGASAVVEPFRLAAHCVLFFFAHSKSSGADLRLRLSDLSREPAA